MISIMIFNFSLLNRRYLFLANLVKKGKIIWLWWNLVPRVIQIRWIEKWCSFVFLWIDTLLAKISKFPIFFQCLPKWNRCKKDYLKWETDLSFSFSLGYKLQKKFETIHLINCKYLSMQIEIIFFLGSTLKQY